MISDYEIKSVDISPTLDEIASIDYYDSIYFRAEIIGRGNGEVTVPQVSFSVDGNEWCKVSDVLKLNKGETKMVECTYTRSKRDITDGKEHVLKVTSGAKSLEKNIKYLLVKDSSIKLAIMFVPVDWQGDLEEFNSFADSQADLIRDNIPLKDCPATVKMLKASKNCVVNIPLDDSECILNQFDIGYTIASCAQAEELEYHYVMGLTNADICGETKGRFIRNARAIYGEAQYPVVTLHELGHIWGLNDEYLDICGCMPGKDWKNRLDPAPPFDGSTPYFGYTSEYCSGTGVKCPDKPEEYPKTCEGNKNPKGGRCVMSYATAEEPRAFANIAGIICFKWIRSSVQVK